MELNKLEIEVLKLQLKGSDKLLVDLKNQLQHIKVIKRELTGSGFYTSFFNDSLSSIEDCDDLLGDMKFGDVCAEIEDLKNGAGFLLYVENGKISMLEGYSYDEPWPEKCDKFTLSFLKDKYRL